MKILKVKYLSIFGARVLYALSPDMPSVVAFNKVKMIDFGFFIENQ